jgi:hypothetical protein
LGVVSCTIAGLIAIVAGVGLTVGVFLLLGGPDPGASSAGKGMGWGLVFVCVSAFPLLVSVLFLLGGLSVLSRRQELSGRLLLPAVLMAGGLAMFIPPCLFLISMAADAHSGVPFSSEEAAYLGGFVAIVAVAGVVEFVGVRCLLRCWRTN